MEIYCESVHDLLAASHSSNASSPGSSQGSSGALGRKSASKESLEVSGLGPGQLPKFHERVPGLHWTEVKSPAEALVRRCCHDAGYELQMLLMLCSSRVCRMVVPALTLCAHRALSCSMRYCCAPYTRLVATPPL